MQAGWIPQRVKARGRLEGRPLECSSTCAPGFNQREEGRWDDPPYFALKRQHRAPSPSFSPPFTHLCHFQFQRKTRFIFVMLIRRARLSMWRSVFRTHVPSERGALQDSNLALCDPQIGGEDEACALECVCLDGPVGDLHFSVWGVTRRM